LISFIVIFFITFLFSAIFEKFLTPIRRISSLKRLSKDRGGGIILLSLLAGIVCSMLLAPEVVKNIYKYYYIGVVGIIIGISSLAINFLHFRSYPRLLIGSLAAVLIAIFGIDYNCFYIPVIGKIYINGISYLVTFGWTLFVLYAVSMFDKIKGLAPGVIIIILSLTIFIAFQTGQTFIALTNLILMAALMGFLRLGTVNAKRSIGPSGVLIIGLSMAVLTLEVGRIGNTQSINLVIPLVIMAVPALEAFLSLIRKIRKRHSLFKPDNYHIYNRLIALQFTHKKSVYLIYFFTIIFGMIGVLLKYTDDKGIITLLFTGIVAFVLLIYRLGYFELSRNLILIDEEMDSKNKIKGKYIPFDRSRFYQNLLFFIFDVIFISLAFLVTYFLELRFGVPEELLFPKKEIILWLSWSVIFWALMIGLNDLYMIEWDTSRVDEIFSILKIIIVGAIFIFIINYKIDIPVLVTKGFFLIYLALLFISLSIGRLILITFLRNYSLLEFKKRPTLIVGINQTAVNIVRQIKHVPVLKFNPIGFIRENKDGNKVDGYPVLGGINDIPDLIMEKNIKEAIIALDNPDPDKILNLIAVFDKYSVSIKLLPEYYSLMSGFRTSHIYGISLVRFISSTMKTWEWIVKRLLDIIISIIILVGLLPLWIILSLAIKMDSRGPVLYRQKRMGKNKLIFNLFKFRSMVKDAEKQSGPQWAQKEDPRITKVGKFLRKSGFDEIPQFINVLIGEMSIVGPRPERPVFIQRLEKQINFYTRRLLVKPGITGWAQLKYKYDQSIDDVKQKLKDDLYYIRNMSIALDIKIMIQTAITLFQKWRLHH